MAFFLLYIDLHDSENLSQGTVCSKMFVKLAYKAIDVIG